MPPKRTEPRTHKPFDFNPPIANPLGQKMLPHVAPAVEKLFWLDALNSLYDRCARPGQERQFLDRVLQDLGVSYQLAAEDMARIPKTGPVIVVANHPFGALDGMILAALLSHVRPDVKVMANYLLGRIPDLRELFLLVDPFGTEKSAKENVGPMRQALRWLKDGKMLAVFPAGEVAHVDLRTGKVEEPAWSDTIARIASRAGVPVVPMFFHGRNSNAFQLMGLLNPKLRTAMLPRELFKKRGEVIQLRVGTAIPHRKLSAMGSDAEVAEFLRQRTLLLGHRPKKKLLDAGSTIKAMAQIAPPQSPDILAAELEKLPPGQLLADAGDMVVYEAKAHQIPATLRELGRLREITYRATGEGTGKSLDLDEFDNWYTHLFIWHKTSRELVGAYRLGITDEIIRARGPAGLYTSTLFKFRPGFIERLGPAIEMGRSFIRAEYQRSYTPLLLLWKGIGRITSSRPHLKTLFGPVSISNDYQTTSKHVMVRFLAAAHGAAEMAGLTRPRHPFRPAGVQKLAKERGLSRLLNDCDTVDDLVAELEPDGKGMPVLLRQYIKLGARFFAFNVDPNFSDALDALMLVDLRYTEPKLLARYMGPGNHRAFLAYHGVGEKA